MKELRILLIRIICCCFGVGICLLGCGGDDNNDNDIDSVSCLAGCLYQEANNMKTCESEEKSCLLDCSGFNDSACMHNCYQGYDQCYTDQRAYQNNCLAQCPCMGDCQRKCTNQECLDQCIMACPGVREFTDKYLNCSHTCNDIRNVCLSGCSQFNPGDWQKWVECEKDCVISAWDCGYNCI